MPGTFDHTTPSGNQVARYEQLREQFIAIEHTLGECVPPGRELSLAKTKLEEAAMWASKGISRGDALFNASTVG